MPEPKLGKLIAVHSTSPAFLQRAAIVAVLSFLFFAGTFILYLVLQGFLYFVLATAFLIVQVFTMIGWWMQKRNSIDIYDQGIAFRKQKLQWDEIARIERTSESGIAIVARNGESLTIPASIHGLDRVEAFIRQSSAFRL